MEPIIDPPKEDTFGLLSLFQSGPRAEGQQSYASLLATDSLLHNLSRDISRTSMAASRTQLLDEALGDNVKQQGICSVAAAAAAAMTQHGFTPADPNADCQSFHNDTSILTTTREALAAYTSEEGVAEAAVAREVARKKQIAEETESDARKQRQAQRRWQVAKRNLDQHNKLHEHQLDAPLPLYTLPSTRNLDKGAADSNVPLAYTGVPDRPKHLDPSAVDSSLPPPTQRESTPTLPKWLRSSPDAVSPSNRPRVASCKRIYSYKTTSAAALNPEVVDPTELVFDSMFESGNLLSVRRVIREEQKPAPLNKPIGQGGETMPPLVVEKEYDLQMHPDVHCKGNTQWFYFSVTNFAGPGTACRFNITNFAKADSLYLDGMQPLLFSTKAAKLTGVGWRRVGSVICYAQNGQEVHEQQISDMRAAGLGCATEDNGADDDESAGSGGEDADDSKPEAPTKQQEPVVAARGCTHTMSFDVEFEHADDLVYMAYSHPYTYTELQLYLDKLQKDPVRAATFSRKKLCETIAGNRCDLLTVTAPPKSTAAPNNNNNRANNRNVAMGNASRSLPDVTAMGSGAADDSDNKPKRLVVLSARVHPGESNASWVIHGILEFLTSGHPAAMVLRREFVFKIVPMLNPDGVINGNYRCSLSGQDLNRQWHAPSRERHPSITALKTLIGAYQSRDPKSVALFCDLHGHSRAKGIFLYGILSDADRQEERRMRRRLERAEAAQYGGTNYATPAASASLGEAAKPAQLRRGSGSWRRRAKVSRYADPRAFPAVLEKRSVGMFTKRKTSFKLGRGKENTARAVVCRELRVQRSYTLEASFCGGVGGAWRSSQFSSFDLVEFGRQYCLALVDFFDLNDEVITMLRLTKLAAAAAEKSARLKKELTQRQTSNSRHRRLSSGGTVQKEQAAKEQAAKEQAAKEQAAPTAPQQQQHPANFVLDPNHQPQQQAQHRRSTRDLHTGGVPPRRPSRDETPPSKPTLAPAHQRASSTSSTVEEAPPLPRGSRASSCSLGDASLESAPVEEGPPVVLVDTLVTTDAAPAPAFEEEEVLLPELVNEAEPAVLLPEEQPPSTSSAHFRDEEEEEIVVSSDEEDARKNVFVLDDDDDLLLKPIEEQRRRRRLSPPIAQESQQSQQLAVLVTAPPDGEEKPANLLPNSSKGELLPQLIPSPKQPAPLQNKPLPPAEQRPTPPGQPRQQQNNSRSSRSRIQPNT